MQKGRGREREEVPEAEIGSSPSGSSPSTTLRVPARVFSTMTNSELWRRNSSSLALPLVSESNVPPAFYSLSNARHRLGVYTLRQHCPLRSARVIILYKNSTIFLDHPSAPVELQERVDSRRLFIGKTDAHASMYRVPRYIIHVTPLVIVFVAGYVHRNEKVLPRNITPPARRCSPDARKRKLFPSKTKNWRSHEYLETRLDAHHSLLPCFFLILILDTRRNYFAGRAKATRSRLHHPLPFFTVCRVCFHTFPICFSTLRLPSAPRYVDHDQRHVCK